MSTKDVRVNDLVSTKQAAEIIGCDNSRVLQLIRAEKFQGVVKFGPRQIFIPKKQVEHYRDNPSTVGRPRKSAPRTRNAAAN